MIRSGLPCTLTLKPDLFPETGTNGWRYFVALPAVQYPVYAVPGRYGHGGLYVLQDRSREFLSKAGLLAKGQTIQVCAGPRFIKLKNHAEELENDHAEKELENATCWPTSFGIHILGDRDPDFEHCFEKDGVTPQRKMMFTIPGPRESLACSSTVF